MKRFILLLAALSVLVGSLPARAQLGEPALPIARPPSAHPRLLLTDAYIQQILIPRVENRAATWETFINYASTAVPESDLHTYPQQVTRSLAVAYLVTGDVQYAERAMRGLLLMVADLEAHPAFTEGAAWDALFVDRTADVALMYDWLYNTLTPTDRAALERVLVRAVNILNDPLRDTGRVYFPTESGTFRFAAYEHLGLRVVWALAAVGLALLGEDEAAPAIIDYARQLFTGWVIPALDDLSGGAWAESPTYGWLAHWASIHTAAAFWTALGENYFDDSAWWYDRLGYELFLRYPGIQQVGNTPSGMKFWGYPAIIGDAERYSEAALLGRAQDALLATIFSGTDHSAWMNWFLAQGTEAGVPTLQGRYAVDEFLWRDLDDAGLKPPGLVWWSAGSGHVFLRSDWERLSDEGTTYISFNAGDRFSVAQAYDQGTITLWRGGGDLITRSGVYSGGLRTDHDANYSGRTIAGNTLLICDLAENFDSSRPNDERNVWLNDCGQRPVLPNSAINPYFRRDNPARYETGTILRFAEEGGSNYLRADLTPAYNSTAYTNPGAQPKVDEVLREVVYIRPGVLVIHDRVKTIDPNTLPISQFHTNAAPVRENDWLRVTAGRSLLYLRGIAPQNTAQITSGYTVAGETIEQSTPNRYENQPYGAYHIQFIPNQQLERHFFLTLMITEEVGVLRLPETYFVDGDGTYGVGFDDWLVMFDDDPEDITGTSFNVFASVSNLLVTGLAPLGSYRVTFADARTFNLQADDAGTLYIFVEIPGEVRLRKR